MSRETDIKLLMDNWEEKHKKIMDISVLSEMV